MLSFKKNIVVGVSVHPELGLEVAQIDFATRTILKYGCKALGYDNLRKEIADLDIFKETLADLLAELEIPKGSEIVLNLPTILFNVVDYPAMMEADQIESAIEEELANHPLFQNYEACISAVKLPISTIQNTKIAYTAAQKTSVIEIAMQITSLGYKVIGIDTSVNSVLNSLIYNDRVDVSSSASWVLLIVENNACRILPMVGKSYTDSFEEKIAIGEVLGDEENYGTVVSAVTPLLKNLPSSRLYVLSRTSVIDAKILASKLKYNGQIVHHNDNFFADAPYIDTVSEIEENIAKSISLDVIGAAINREFGMISVAPINMFNSSLGEIYENQQPLKLHLGSRLILLTIENMIIASVVFALLAIIICIAVNVPLKAQISKNDAEMSNMNARIAKIQKYLDDNSDVSSDAFSEGDEVRFGLQHNKNIYSYYTIVGTEIPKKLWLTSLELGQNVTIEGQADNLESIYSFFRNIKDYNPNSEIKLQKLGLASKSKLVDLAEDESFDTDSIITSMNADFYEFRISDAPEVVVKKDKKDSKSNAKSSAPELLTDIDLDE